MKPGPPFPEGLDRISATTTMRNAIKATAWENSDRRRCIMAFDVSTLGGPVPQTPWVLSLGATMSKKGRHAGTECRPRRSSHRGSARRSGCIPAWPYPPDDGIHSRDCRLRSKNNMLYPRTEQSKGTAEEKEKARNSNLNFPCFLSNQWGVPQGAGRISRERTSLPEILHAN